MAIAITGASGALYAVRTLAALLDRGLHVELVISDYGRRLLRDELHDLAGAAAAFRRLPADYPASILRDDAAYELAVTLARAGDPRGACAVAAKLAASFPDSKYVARTGELGCR